MTQRTPPRLRVEQNTLRLSDRRAAPEQKLHFPANFVHFVRLAGESDVRPVPNVLAPPLEPSESLGAKNSFLV